ncbi:uncharacterized protein LOC128193056 isoform X8 [Crassostrea angulata]|uniref:uncharacterized protein isoform X9 n=1 Tax=Magallana gigas TaxID=29159 RepID=UPI0005C3AF0B|nr:uncharacterized protein LOC105330607 isoform X11 [Crassostrea gigas]XP_034300099.1 uncharacterized protein LOC105338669 isoform X9 [Crassostrea gigas]XP_052722221.1 uncharacterized protein LOC128193056 isoform X8 [Crassostrea angulata]|eukprot:XP_011430690.1 PREDICTED: uncharacterized protein LOC105330607 isoform X9 [Crassostrea gigas]
MGGSGSKKKSNKEDANVGERKHPYEECNPSENDDDKPDPGKECKVVRAPRQYEEIDKDFEQDKANAKESNNSRLSQKQQPGDLNYVDVEFTKPKKKKKSKKDKESSETSDVPQPSVEYSEVIVQNSKPSLKG